METNGLVESIHSVSLVDEAHRQVRDLILTGRLRPGEPLKDSVLAAEMGISRSPVREALRLLEQSGLVEKTANRSYRITAMAAEDLPELASLRLADETLAIRTIVHHRIALDPLEERMEAFRQADGDPIAAAAADIGFHRAVVELAGLPRLTVRYAEVSDQIRLALLASDIETWGRSNPLVGNHLILVDALHDAMKTGRTRKLMEAWEYHVLGGMRSLDALPPIS